jgi:phosphoribosyl 1,2-cyclic phosphate phosphodiesterase
MKLTFLGTGTSHGVPPIDCMLQNFASCPQGVCRASVSDPRHRRTRSSVLVEWDNVSVLVDIGPDFREQALREKIRGIDAVLVTHGHADHIYGIPDIRSYTRNAAIPLYGSAETMNRIREAFSYIFDPATLPGGGIPRITTTAVNGPFSLLGRDVTPIRVDHLALDGCYGWRIGTIAIIPDVKSVLPGEIGKLAGIDLLVLNCLRRGPSHGSHLTLDESVALARKIGPRRCCFIHMSHDIHYQIDKASLDPWMEFAWDGLQVEVDEA